MTATTTTTAAKPSEVREIHTNLLKCTLEIESSRAWWGQPSDTADRTVADRAFAESWFGARSLPRVKVLVSNMRTRFDAYPHALRVLREWQHMEPGTRALICHWHLQLTDPLYRAFSGDFLVGRHDAVRAEATRDMVTRWVGDQGPGRWTTKTRVQFASQLLVSAKAAGLIENLRGPRRLLFPRVGDDALTYLLYLLRGVELEGTLLDNPYLASVGLTSRLAEDRFRALEALHFRRQGDLVDFGWVYRDLEGWAHATVAARDERGDIT